MTGLGSNPRRTLNSAELSRLSERLGLLLRVGVLLSAAFLVAGMLVAASSSGPASVFPTGSTGGKPSWHEFTDDGAAVGLVLVGLILLVATPIARVVLSAETFAAARENDYVLVLLTVLGILAASVLVGLFL